VRCGIDVPPQFALQLDSNEQEFGGTPDALQRLRVDHRGGEFDGDRLARAWQ
jgi:hypothetical protein